MIFFTKALLRLKEKIILNTGLLSCIVLLGLIPWVAFAKDKNYVQEEYYFKFTYDASKVSSTENHWENSTLILNLNSGASLEVNSRDDCGMEHSNLCLYNSDCHVGMTSSHFKYFYECKKSVRASFQRVLSDRCLAYDVHYYGYGNKIDYELFFKVLFSFELLPDEHGDY